MANNPRTGLSLAEYPASEVADYVICELSYDSRIAVPPMAAGTGFPAHQVLHRL